jgi:hypothetical protein
MYNIKIMPKIDFSYIFNEDINRIFECFSDIGVNSHIFNTLIYDLKITKGEDFNQENTEISFFWKNYYNFKMIVDKIVKENLCKILSFKSIIIDKVPIQINVTFSFYWDTIQERTIFINTLEYYDTFFTDLIKNEYNENDHLNLCKNIENYLSKCFKGLERNYSCLIDTSLEEAWKYISHPKLFYEIISKDMIVLKEGQINIDSPIELFVKDNSSKLVPLTTLNVQNMMISPFFAQVTYTTLKNVSFPSIKLIIQIKKIENNKCFGTINVKPLEPSLSYEMFCHVFKFWKKRITELFHFFEKRKKLDKSNK